MKDIRGIVKFPNWHKSILTSREQQREAGNQTPLNWEKAKERIRHQIDNISSTDVLTIVKEARGNQAATLAFPELINIAEGKTVL